jgi:hypothetical protein
MDADQLITLFELLDNASADPDEDVLAKLAMLTRYKRRAQEAGRQGRVLDAVHHEGRAEELEGELLARVTR